MSVCSMVPELVHEMLDGWGDSRLAMVAHDETEDHHRNDTYTTQQCTANVDASGRNEIGRTQVEAQGSYQVIDFTAFITGAVQC